MSVDVTKTVRQVLVKNWLDLSKIRLQVAGGTVIIRGQLEKTHDQGGVDGLFVEQLEQQLRNTKGLKQIRWSLNDWVFERGEWRTTNREV